MNSRETRRGPKSRSSDTPIRKSLREGRPKVEEETRGPPIADRDDRLNNDAPDLFSFAPPENQIGRRTGLPAIRILVAASCGDCIAYSPALVRGGIWAR